MMSYIAYRKSDSRRLDRIFNSVHAEFYQSESAAKAAITRVCNAQVGRDTFDYAVAESDYFYRTIEMTEVVQNLMSGRDVIQSVNTPRCCDPSTELYWSM